MSSLFFTLSKPKFESRMVVRKSEMTKDTGIESKFILLIIPMLNSAAVFSLNVQRNCIPIWISMTELEFKYHYPKRNIRMT
jgi:hypothetical protein